jgi:hypothetical protein
MEDIEGEHMDESNDTNMGDDQPTLAPATSRSSLLAFKMGSHDVTERAVDDHGKKQLNTASGADSNAMMRQSLENGAANETIQSPAKPVVKEIPAAFVPDYEEFMRQTDKYGAAKESPGLISDIGKGFDEIANGPKGPKADRRAYADAKEEINFGAFLKDDDDARLATLVSAAPKSPKASRQAAGGSSSRTGAAGGVRKPANSNAARPTTFAGHRSTQRSGQQPAGTRGADPRQPQPREDRSARSSNTPLKGGQHASQNLRSQSQTVESRDEGIAKFGSQAAEGSFQAQVNREAFQNHEKTARGESSSHRDGGSRPQRTNGHYKHTRPGFQTVIDLTGDPSDSDSEDVTYATLRHQEEQKRLDREKQKRYVPGGK